MARTQTGGRSKAFLFLIGSLVVAGAITLVIYQIINRYQQAYDEAIQERNDLVEVVVATQDLYVGLSIVPEDLEVKKMLPESVDPEQVFAVAEDVVNQIPRERILAGEPIRLDRLASSENGVGLNAIITPGRRAMTIETDTESGMAGLLQPNNYVDVIVTIKPDDQGRTQQAWQTETILQYIKVLAVGDQLGRVQETEEEKKKRRTRRRSSVTLEVTPEESEKLALAASRGDLHLVLRSDVDILERQTDGPLTSGALIGLTNADLNAAKAARKSKGSGRKTSKAKAPETEKTNTAEVVTGSETKIEEFGEDGEKINDDGRKRRNR